MSTVNDRAGAVPANDFGDLARIAETASGFRLAGMPPTVVNQARLTVLDTIGCMVAGSDSAGAAKLIAAEISAAGEGPASVFGTRHKFPMQAAARLNGYMGDVFEHNDLISGHAGIANVAALLALSEAREASGAEFLEALVIGLEVTSAVYLGAWDGMTAYTKPFEEVAISPPSIPNSIGVAAAAAHLMGLGADGMARAMAISASIAGWCPAEAVFRSGGDIKPLLFGGWPASAGLQAAAYASAGLTGPARVLESEVGYYSTIARRGHPAPSIGKVWRVERPRRKLHACCGYIHSAFDMLVDMRQCRVPLSEAAEIRVFVPSFVVGCISKPALPTESLGTVFHGEYSFALAVAGVEIIEPEHSTGCAEFSARADVRDAFSRIRIRADWDLTHSLQSRVVVIAPDGTEMASMYSHSPRGAADNPMTAEDVRAKFMRQAGARLVDRELQDFVGAVDRLDRSPDTAWLVNALNPAPHKSMMRLD
ncbi:MAG: MmgE/PrpD family protein [Hyphomicrobiales bacterium]|nr:MmgE/PrpD family protein [Hyphomicrobiales bacterium]